MTANYGFVERGFHNCLERVYLFTRIIRTNLQIKFGLLFKQTLKFYSFLKKMSQNLALVFLKSNPTYHLSLTFLQYPVHTTLDQKTKF